MRLYEVVYILDPALEESAITAKLDHLHQLATSKGGEVSAIDHWGTRQLAYPINKLSRGYYVAAHFTAVPEALPEYERMLKLDDDIVRYLLVLNEGEPTGGDSIMGEPRPKRIKDEDEDEMKERMEKAAKIRRELTVEMLQASATASGRKQGELKATFG